MRKISSSDLNPIRRRVEEIQIPNLLPNGEMATVFAKALDAGQRFNLALLVRDLDPETAPVFVALQIVLRGEDGAQLMDAAGWMEWSTTVDHKTFLEIADLCTELTGRHEDAAKK